MMLASPHTAIAPTVEAAIDKLRGDAQWAYELKLDGVRCEASVANGRVRLTSRSGQDLTDRFPDVTAVLSGFPTALYDGEIVAPDLTFNSIARRVQSTKPASIKRVMAEVPALFMLFDVPEATARNYDQRREAVLRSCGAGVLPSPAWDDIDVAWSYVTKHNLEGLIAKRRSSGYRNGRSPDWVKLKVLRTVSAIVVGFTPGEGERDGKIGALELALLQDGEIVRIGKVGTGFNDDDLHVLAARINEGRPFVVEVQYANATPDRQLRFPSFQGIRDDVDVMACTTEQIKESA